MAGHRMTKVAVAAPTQRAKGSSVFLIACFEAPCSRQAAVARASPAKGTMKRADDLLKTANPINAPESATIREPRPDKWTSRASRESVMKVVVSASR